MARLPPPSLLFAPEGQLQLAEEEQPHSVLYPCFSSHLGTHCAPLPASRLRAVWDKTTARLSEGFKLEPEPAVLRSAQEAAEVATMAVGADPQAAGV